MSGEAQPIDGWHTSTWSTSGSCVEVAFSADQVHVRNSNDREGASLTFTGPEWRAFLAGVRDGQFDGPRARAAG